MELQLTLLGPPRLDALEAPDTSVHLGAKPLALLAFLALERGPHTRDELAALLWSDSPQAAARASLRQALRQVRQVAGEILETDRKHVRLVRDIPCDAVAFLAAATRSPEEAAEYPADRFLSGFSVRHADSFDDWTAATRQRFLKVHRDALRTATTAAMSRSHWRDAARWADRWIACEPLSDEAVRHVVEAYYMAGDRNGALSRYEDHRRLVHEQLGTEPSAALHNLVERIGTGGRVEPIAEPPTDPSLPQRGFTTSLLGRENEWRRLADLWKTTTQGAGSTVLIEGESGIGKTRLAKEFLQWVTAEGATALMGQGYDAEAGIPYMPVADGLRAGLTAPGLASTAPQWLAELARILPHLRDRFPHLSEATAAGDADRRGQLFESVAQALLGLASERPTVLFIDDLQRCDADTCALLHFLTRRLEQSQVLILATVTLGEVERATPASRLRRAVRGDAGTTSVITLEPLTADDVWGMIRELGNIAAPEGARRFAAQVHRVTDGNPFHILELLKSLFTQGMLTVDEQTGEWLATPAVGAGPYQGVHMPRTVHDAIAERSAGLPYELRDLLATAAVAGRPVTPELLSHVHGISRLRAAALCDSLVDRLLLAEEAGVYGCAHPIVQDVVRADLTPARRKEVHRAIAMALQHLTQIGRVEGVAGEIARHAERGGEPALAFRAALEASGVAADGEAFEEALSWLDLAARTAPSTEHAAVVNDRTADLMRAAGWPRLPATGRRTGTPIRGFARHDLDLRTP